MPFVPPNEIRDILIDLMTASDFWTTNLPGLTIYKHDPKGTSTAEGVKIAFVMPGMDWDTGSLGPNGVGRWEFKFEMAILVYAPCTPIKDDYTTSQSIGEERDAESTLCITTTMKVLQALFQFQIDPNGGPGQRWWRTELTGRPYNSTFVNMPQFFHSVTQICIHSRQTK